jgi:hypothetical protein
VERHVPHQQAHEAVGEGGAGVGKAVAVQRAAGVLGQQVAAQEGLAIIGKEVKSEEWGEIKKLKKLTKE